MNNTTRMPNGETQITFSTPATTPNSEPATAGKGWIRRHKILSGLIAAAALVGVIAVASNGSSTTTTTTAAPQGPVAAPAVPAAPAPPAAAAPSPAAPVEPAVGVNTPVRDGKFEFTVTQVEKGVPSVGDKYLNAKAQGQFVLVHVTVTNIGKEPAYLLDGNQKVTDAQGRQFSADSSAAIYLKDNSVLFKEINPGNSVKGTLVYDMPKDASPAAIELHDSMFSGGAKVNLG